MMEAQPTEIAAATEVEPLAVAAPAASAAQQRSSVLGIAGGIALLVAAWAALALWGLGNVPFHTKGEPREALVVWEMTHGGGWILPQRNGSELPSKPPLFHWLGALTSLARGATDEGSIRFPSAALSLLGLLAVFVAGTALSGTSTGLFAALVLMTSFEWARAATNARVDMTLTVGLEIAFFSLLFFWRSGRSGWLVPLYGGIAWAVLGKGPVGIALPGATTVALLALTWNSAAARERRLAGLFEWSRLRQMRLLRGAIVVAVLAGTWYLLALLIGGWAFFRKQVLAENVFTFLDDPDFGGGHRHGPFYLPAALLLGWLPWSVFLPGVAVTLWQRRGQISRRDWQIFALIWIAVVFLFFEVAASKRGVYLLSLYPAMALLLGWWWSERVHAAGTQPWLGKLVAAVAWAIAGVAVLAALLVVLESLRISPLPLLQTRLRPKAADGLALGRDVVRACGMPLAGILMLTTIATAMSARFATTARWWQVFATWLGTTAMVLLAARLLIMPVAAARLTQRDFMTDVLQTIETGGQLCFYKTFDYQTVYYSKRHIPSCDEPWTGTGSQYVLVESALWNSRPPSLTNAFQPVALPHEGRLTLLKRVGAP